MLLVSTDDAFDRNMIGVFIRERANSRRNRARLGNGTTKDFCASLDPRIGPALNPRDLSQLFVHPAPFFMCHIHAFLKGAVGAEKADVSLFGLLNVVTILQEL